MRILARVEAAEAAAQADASTPQLLERAGYAIAQFCAAQFKFRSVCVVCGKGRKGAAGLVAAKVLAGMAEEVTVLVLAESAADLAPEIAGCVPDAIRPIWIAEPEGFDAEAVATALEADLIIDAVIGTGLRPPLDARAGRAVTAINEASGTVVSVDLPSGVDADHLDAVEASGGNMVFAHGVVALIAPKPAHVFSELTAGPVAVSEIGTQPIVLAGGSRVAVVTGRDVGLAFPRRIVEAEESDFGHVLVIGGARGKAGAAALTGLAALHAGAGRVTIACRRSAEATIAGFAAGLTTYPLPETDDGSIAMMARTHISALLDGKEAVILGPGLSVGSDAAGFVADLLTACRAPVVLDGEAAALLFAGAAPRPKRMPYRVLMLERSHLAPTRAAIGTSERLMAARQIAKESGACVVVKGANAIVAGVSGEVWINLTGGPHLAKAGMSDVLSGVIGAVLARRHDGQASPAEHAPASFLRDLRVAAALHLFGITGDIARDGLHEHAVVATDLIEALPAAFRDCDTQVDQGLYYLRK
jgi:NAD(P)H-hydrate epimerase